MREKRPADNYDTAMVCRRTAARGGHNGVLKASLASSESEKNQFALEVKQCRLGRRNWTAADAGERVDWSDTSLTHLRKLIK